MNFCVQLMFERKKKWEIKKILYKEYFCIKKKFCMKHFCIQKTFV